MTQPTSYDQALAQSRAYVKETLKALPKGARLTKAGPSNDVPCSDAGDPPPDTPVSIGVEYKVYGIDPSDGNHLIDEIIAYWTKKGWKAVDRTDNPPDVIIMSTSDESTSYNIGFTASGKDFAFLGVGSPCVPPKGYGPDDKAAG